MTAEWFSAEAYPHGCRCAVCFEEFVMGDRMLWREVDPTFLVPVHEACQDGPLTSGHPLHERATLKSSGEVVGDL